MRAGRQTFGFAAALLFGIAASGCGEDGQGIRSDDNCAAQSLYGYVDPSRDAGPEFDEAAWAARRRHPDGTKFTAQELADAKAAFAKAANAKCLTPAGHTMSLDGG